MGYFPVRYDSRVVIYERKMFIRLATEFRNHYIWIDLKCGLTLNMFAFIKSGSNTCLHKIFGEFPFGTFAQIHNERRSNEPSHLIRNC